jgi:hypothetical protein
MEGSSRSIVFRKYSGIFLEGLRKLTKNLRIAGLRAANETRDLPKTKLKCYPLDHDF